MIASSAMTLCSSEPLESEGNKARGLVWDMIWNYAEECIDGFLRYIEATRAHGSRPDWIQSDRMMWTISDATVVLACLAWKFLGG